MSMCRRYITEDPSLSDNSSGFTKCLYGQDALDGTCEAQCGEPAPNDCRCMSKEEVKGAVVSKIDTNNALGTVMVIGSVVALIGSAIAWRNGYKPKCQKKEGRSFGEGCSQCFLWMLFFSPVLVLPGILMLIEAAGLDPETHTEYWVACGADR